VGIAGGLCQFYCFFVCIGKHQDVFGCIVLAMTGTSPCVSY
jgi:hypothetical protein